MKDFIGIFESLFEKEWLREHILDLYRLERKQTFPAYRQAARYIFELLEKEGIEV